MRVKLVEPGYCPNTRFTSNTRFRLEDLIPEAYAPFARGVLAAFVPPAAVTTESDVAEAVCVPRTTRLGRSGRRDGFEGTPYRRLLSVDGSAGA